ncbi:SRPBCC domain-containing protein [Actinomadura sp. DC4]|uniref:SRPBCC domain-containing protein n=1 Tax=Actinomadura sp. DC4 TaxID=3055069 RepID=UPI0025AF83DC|nr:SRPBCC domain-containing protein [Actinomadura sp. DC4]MDN3357925.1 hypothetical protein [Actinomadura sp. DC4]
MAERFEVTWEGALPASPQAVWDAFTAHTTGWLWEIAYEPRLGGAEQGLSGGGGTVTAWEPHRHFTTAASGGFNELDYVLEPQGPGTYLRFRHRGEFGEDYDLNLDACRRHTAFYYHSLGEYLRHFAGQDAAYTTFDVPCGFAELRRALGVAGGVKVGDRVRSGPVDGVVDYVTDTFLGVRGASALYRFYGRDRWGWPVGVGVHEFSLRSWLSEVVA